VDIVPAGGETPDLVPALIVSPRLRHPAHASHADEHVRHGSVVARTADQSTCPMGNRSVDARAGDS
jgi:hypothetical protein